MANSQHGKNIRTMFNRISPRYDMLNRILSGGNDMRWRKRAVKLLGDLSGKILLDLCCGSGDFLLIIEKKYGKTVTLYGADFAEQMLQLARKRLSVANKSHIVLCQADAQLLPFANNSIDAVTIGFGIRNVADKTKALADIYRILAPGGKLIIIEPSIPKNRLIAFLFSLYFGKIMPFIGGLISRDYRAYKYLNDSVEAFPAPDIFCRMMTDAGFEQVKGHPQLMGTATIYFGTKKATS